jgi:electron transfer flavoprotein alpha subunit
MPATVAADAAPQIRVIAEPACLVFAVADAAHGRLSPHDRQIMGAARVLADAASGAVVLLAPPLQESPGAAGADRVVSLPDADDPELCAAAIAGAIASLSPRHVLFPESADGGDLARRVAALTGEGLFSDAEALSPRAAIRPVRAARIEQVTAPPRLLTIAADRVAPHTGPEHEGREIVLPEVAAQRRLASPEAIAVDPSQLPLAEAAFVVAAGNGVSDFDSFARLTRALGATPGASRVVCDAGLMPRDRQVGASGSVLDATCYLAFGIAGAPQHLQGVARVQHVVAVNTDLHAAMIARAELAIVADAQKVMPALLAALETS